MSTDPDKAGTADSQGDESGNVPAGLAVTDPTDTDHPTGAEQARENAATESPS